MKQKLSTVLLTLLVVLLLGCKGEKGDVGPAGATGPTGASGSYQDWNFKEGAIKGNATGTLLDESTFSYNFDFQGNFYNADNSYTVNSPDEISINLEKTYAGDGDKFDYGNFGLKIAVKSLSDLSGAQVKSFSFDIIKDLGNNKYHKASYYWYNLNSTGSATVSGLSYNASTGVLTGNFTVSVDKSIDSGSLTITNGSFSSKISNVVARKAAY